MKIDNLVSIVIFIALVFAGGIVAGVVYFQMGTLQTVLETINVTVPFQDSNSPLQTFQDILSITVYPLLGLRTSLIYLSYFLVFALIIAMAVSAYASYQQPIFFVVHLLFMTIVTYFSIILSNAYQTLLQNSFFSSMMLPFVIYNYLMLYLPQVMFFTGILAGTIAFINIIKPQAQLSQDLNYGVGS